MKRKFSYHKLSKEKLLALIKDLIVTKGKWQYKSCNWLIVLAKDDINPNEIEEEILNWLLERKKYRDKI
jgi:hypothetical protein